MNRYQLGLYDPCEPDEPPRLMDGVFTDAPEDRRDMASAIYHYNRWAAKQSDVFAVLGIFPVRPAVVGAEGGDA
jgi:hypothetical protein